MDKITTTEQSAAAGELLAAVRKAHEHIASVGYPANASVEYDKSGEWIFAEAIPRAINAAEIKAAFLTLDAALAAFQPCAGAGVPEVAMPKEREVARIGDMHTRHALRVGFDGDSDVYLSTTSPEGEGVEFCTIGSGGGKSPRTRNALVALMVAMEADNADDPRRDWLKQRLAPQPATTEGES